MSKRFDEMEALARVQAGELTIDEFMELRTADEAADVKISTSYAGTVSLNIGNRFPVSQYADDWLLILAAGDQIRAHIEADVPQYHRAMKRKAQDGAMRDSESRVVKLSRSKGDEFILHTQADADKWEADRKAALVAAASKKPITGEVTAATQAADKKAA